MVFASDVTCIASYTSIVALVERTDVTGLLYVTEGAPYTLYGDSSERYVT